MGIAVRIGVPIALRYVLPRIVNVSRLCRRMGAAVTPISSVQGERDSRFPLDAALSA
jgi:hypothetical protein